MIYQGIQITVSESIADRSAVIVFNNEELIITEVGIKTYGHKIIRSKNDDDKDIYSINYLEDYEYFKDVRTRKVLIEKSEKRGGYLSWQYNFFEPVEVLGKAYEFKRFEKLFPELTEINKIFTPETTLILKRAHG